MKETSDQVGLGKLKMTHRKAAFKRPIPQTFRAHPKAAGEVSRGDQLECPRLTFLTSQIQIKS